MWRDNLRGILYIALKDIKTYYLKPPAISWGIFFPITWIMAFYLRNPKDFIELVPGLISMTILFSTTAAEAVVLNFELRVGTLERLLLAPISSFAVIFGKIFGGVLFGFLTTTIVTIFSLLILNLHPNLIYLFMIIIPSLFLFSSLGAFLCLMVKEVFEAQTLLNLPRFLMIFLSGVVYPISKLPFGLKIISYILPLTYTVEGLKGVFFIGFNKIVFLDFIILIFFFILFILPSKNLLERKFK